MENVILGKTGITVNKNGFGALPIQRIPEKEAIYLLHKAYAGGIIFFDTARFYTDSEEKIGKAFKGIRNKVIIASKTMAQDASGFRNDLKTTLRELQTDYLDIYQFHNPGFCPKPEDKSGLYEAMTDAVKKGYVRHIGITNHRSAVAHEAIDSGLYETLQFPFCYLSGEKELELVRKCETNNMGFIAMKALSGGLITNSAAAYAFLAQYKNVLPIWGIQRPEELNEFLKYIISPPSMNRHLTEFIEQERIALQGYFCRGCGYCMPCPVDIEINTCARMSLLLRRSPAALQLTKGVQEKMKKTEDCIHCNRCKEKCPYKLDTPALLQKNYEDYKNVLAGRTIV
ncbi:MAG: aldo/keto reductase [Tannerella sp.]|jgi:aryl-alcohol dehydrogenase-like predicted oxidoreductase/NAD-dependent dihydropyrimidine dehydrogenase PreA subunit|nr:aldo/keto reductase [Tannerella sp.]